MSKIPYRTISMKSSNSYLLKTAKGFILIDSGFNDKRTKLVKALSEAGCKPGDLQLVLLTHGDTDHTGNCAFLQKQYGAKIAIHKDDAGMTECGDMTCNRKDKPDKSSFFFRLISLFDRTNDFEPFTPDFYLQEGDSLKKYGLDAEVVYLPGHSKGSIGILTSEGDLFSGDLFVNFRKPKMHFLIFDLQEANASIEKIKKMAVRTVYPGHGKPFAFKDYIQ
jgi:glyoxylase-like metal-dependent hydrolase (beta-lactamase superfamily II)